QGRTSYSANMRAAAFGVATDGRSGRRASVRLRMQRPPFGGLWLFDVQFALENAFAARDGPQWFRLCSHEWYAVVIVERAVACSFTPVPVGLVAVFRRAAKLFFGDAGPIAAEPCIVFQRLPWQRIVIIAEPQEPAETKNGIGHPARDLVDH